ncbi:MAG: protein-L-isoaspartate(D-aspartate) O-methyltransferase [Cyclobacteriaceae bacterium]|nr:protein-L-isoaspartate(D-aspartate) O-methyltransferase [Cyclobacteriaceae bacterium]
MRAKENLSNKCSVALFLMMLSFSIHAIAQDFGRLREKMVSDQLVKRGVKSKPVLDAMRKVERHKFVPTNIISEAYNDSPLPIGEGQTISQPYIVAFMTEILSLKPTDRVLEIGTGSGYQAAILAELCNEVYTIEIAEILGLRADSLLGILGYKNISVRVGDGYLGWPEAAPFDAIIVTCSPSRVPQPLQDQLKEGGRMIIPVGEAYTQELVLITKENGKLKRQNRLPVLFVPMRDGKGKRY